MKKIPRPFLYLVLASVAAMLAWSIEKPTKEKTGDALNQIFLPNLDASAIARIRIEHLMNGVELKKENGEWLVTNITTKLKENMDNADGKKKEAASVENWQKADAGKVATDLDILKMLRVTSMTGDNPAKHGYFEVNPVGEQVWLYDSADKELVHLYFGKMGTGFNDSYVRKEGDNRVYLADKFLRPSFPVDANGWKTPAENPK